MSQKELANVLRTNNSSVCDWECGRTEPDLDTLTYMAIFFDVTADYLLGLEDETGAKVHNAIYDNHGNITFNQH